MRSSSRQTRSIAVFTLQALAWPWPGQRVNMARLHLRARFGLALAAVTFSIAGRTYKMADPCILLWFIYLFLLKPGSHERHKDKQRKQRMNSPLRLAKTKQREFFFVSAFVLLFAYAWTMILCLCL